MVEGLRDTAFGGQANPLLVEDDDDVGDIAARIRRLEEETQTGRELARWAASLKSRINCADERPSPFYCSDVDREERIEDALQEEIAEIIDLTDDDDDPETILAESLALREEAREISSHTLPNGTLLRAGMTLEVNNVQGADENQFIRVDAIIEPGWGAEVVIRGLLFERTRQLKGMLPARLNEVVLVSELRSWERRRGEEQALVEVKPSDVKRTRELRITNAPFPSHRFDKAEICTKGRQWVEENSPLVCRFRRDVYYHGHNPKPFEWALVKIGEGEADSDYRLPDETVLNRWRGGKIPGGSHKPGELSRPVVDLDPELSGPAQTPSLTPGQRYTAGDVFAGAGGASRGIERAGVKLLFAVDHWDPAAQSLRSNFPDSRIYNMDVTDFITSPDTRADVDLLHLSPPCQFWSPAHTIAGKNDEHNIAVLFSCTDLVEKFRPRLFTVEQTYGILSPKFEQYFNTFLHGFTKLEYSVRWKIAPLANYGVPQMRRRLIMIGSAPGEKLPPFPPPTHSKDGAGGLKPWATPKSALASIPANFNHRHHQPHLRRSFNAPKKPWDPTKLAKTITTNGGQNYHWSGKRNFTPLEYAVLQGFPLWHRFEGGNVKKQIGNAFAPSVVKILYDHLVGWLLAQDGFDPSARRGVRAGLPRDLLPENYVDLLDDSDGEDVDIVGQEGGEKETSDDDDNDNDDDDDDDDDVVCVGYRRSPPTLSEMVRHLNRVAKEEGGGELMDLDELSDTETLRDGEDGRQRNGRGHTEEDAWILSD